MPAINSVLKDKKTIRILGIDPGSRITGYGVIDKCGHDLQFVSCGIIKSNPKWPFPQRLKEIFEGVQEVVADRQPQIAAVEDLFFAKNPNSALKLGQARGAIIVAILQNNLEVREFTAKQVKQAVAGYGQAGKSQVQHMVRVLLNLTATPSEDAADALAISVCLAHHMT